MNCRGLAILGFLAFSLEAPLALGQAVIDPGFENYAVPAGGFLLPTTGPWQFNNNAGVVEPFSPPTYAGTPSQPFLSWSATLPAFEGAQYASSYAGSDFFDQSVFFPAAGSYRLTVYAASPQGSVIINGGSIPLTTGDFRFTVGGQVTGPTFTPPLNSSWTPYSTIVNIPAAGSRLIGFHTTKSASYFINFDAFSVTLIPEPTSIVLLGLGGGVAIVRRRSS